ncbi:MAG: sugar phosphate isomerase/epimerase family protein [Limisphaerales bacterium]
MENRTLTRRTFFQQTLAAAGALSLTGPVSLLPSVAAAREAAQHSLRLGGPSFAKTEDPEELALAHRKLGYHAAYCPNVALKDSDKIQAYTRAFAKHDVMIAEVGRWVNLLESDPDKRRQNLQTVTDGLALAEAIGARCCVDIAGSFNPSSWFGPDPKNLSREFFDASVENARKIIDAVKPTRSTFCYEVMGWSWPDTPEHYLKMIRAIDRKGFSVHLDPCNLVNSPEKFYQNTALLNECFDKLGRWIVSCHAKDLTWDVEMNIHFREVAPGKGSLDYATYLRRLAQLPQDAPLMLEHLQTAEQYDGAREHILKVGKDTGLSFG